MRNVLFSFFLIVFCACEVAKSKWEDGSRRLENSAKVFESEGVADVKEEDEKEPDDEVERVLRRSKEERENRRRQEIYRGQEHWADDIR